MKVNNPFINQVRNDTAESPIDLTNSNAATKRGISLKTLFLLLAGTIAGVIVAVIFNNMLKGASNLSDAQFEQQIKTLYIGLGVSAGVAFFGFIIGRIFPGSAPIAAPLYAVGEGACLGALCALCEIFVPGITAAAGVGTAAIVGVTYLAYVSGLKNHMGKVAVFFLVYAIALIITVLALVIFTAVNNLSYDQMFWIDMVVAILYVGYGVLMLLLNFAEADSLVENGMDKKYEWSVALGIAYTVFMIFYYVLYIILLIASKTSKKN